MDLTGYFELQSIAEMLKARGAELIVAGRMTQIREWRQSRGLAERAVVSRYFSSLEDTVQAYRSMAAGAAAVNHVTATGDDATAR